MIFADGVRNKRYSGAIVAPMPHGPGRTDTAFKRLVNFSVGEGFRLAVVPSEAAEGGQILRQILLEVEAESILPRDVPGMISDVGTLDQAGAELSYGVAVDAHIGIVGVGQNANDA